MPAETNRRSRPSWLVPVVALAVAAALIAVIVGMGGGSQSGSSGSSGPSVPGAPAEVHGPEQSNLIDVARRDAADLLAVGPVDAPVALVVFSDYQCPFCAKWSAETLPLMVEHAEAGDLRIEWRDVNVFGADSQRAARASYAAGLQGEFWAYHDALFAGGEIRSADELSEGGLTALADELSLDTDQFVTDLTSTETVQQVTANQELGVDLGVYSTPAFILGGQPILGAQPTEVFLDAFETALDAAK